MVVVKAEPGESTDKIVARFRKLVTQEGIINEARERERYKKPSERRREKQKEVEYWRKLERKRNN